MSSVTFGLRLKVEICCIVDKVSQSELCMLTSCDVVQGIRLHNCWAEYKCQYAGSQLSVCLTKFNLYHNGLCSGL